MQKPAARREVINQAINFFHRTVEVLKYPYEGYNKENLKKALEDLMKIRQITIDESLALRSPIHYTVTELSKLRQALSDEINKGSLGNNQHESPWYQLYEVLSKSTVMGAGDESLRKNINEWLSRPSTRDKGHMIAKRVYGSLKQMPLLLNDHPWCAVAQWRLKMGK